jgi:phosphatidylglycerophosphate synthase
MAEVRIADVIVVVRTLLVLPVLYLIMAKANPYLVVGLIVVVFVMDGMDGYFARRDIKRGKKPTEYGARLDIAGDRAVEYSFWVLYTYLNMVPLVVVFLIIFRHSFADALTSAKGKTFSNMHTAFGKIAYSHSSRFLSGALKFVTFSYLALVYVAGYPAGVGYVLTGILVAYILLRGAAEIYESII